MSKLAFRKVVALDTIARSPALIQEHELDGATALSSFISQQLPPLDASSCPGHPPSKVDVVNSDSFAAARSFSDEAKGKIAVLNLASDEYRAGGWTATLSRTQEEALCYSSTLYHTLSEAYYPWPNIGPGSVAGVYSPGVVVHRDDLDHELVEFPRESEKRIVTAVLTVAAPHSPQLTKDRQRFADPSVLEDLRGKIRLVYRMAASNGKEYIVLGAMGCGAYNCPPVLVANEMKNILLDSEFKGWFKKVTFAVYSKGQGNYDVFKDVFWDVVL
ncbi:hypothetical protein IW261DRAFT_1335808 [Armillaria novae-zelandiae]|uniref:Microbial-type PARG catalytic domain-containing protein n=1 Tax=Armillaria novae-zelandiae TaxID=153914 RepID=A0AA39UID5_9AGAR|nr:hypothetical protein IW261DRAFT_1335808 [Armillaria novae-zelandiae]